MIHQDEPEISLLPECGTITLLSLEPSKLWRNVTHFHCMAGVPVCTQFKSPSFMKNHRLVGPELIDSWPQKQLAYFTTEGLYVETVLSLQLH